MEDVKTFFIAGRPGAAPQEIEDIAAAIFLPGQRAAENDPAGGSSEPGGWPTRPCPIRGRDGRVLDVVEVPYHPDERCMAVLNQLRGAELGQAIGRARGIRRTAGKPGRYRKLLAPSIPELRGPWTRSRR